MHYLLVLYGDPETGADRLGPNTTRRCLGAIRFARQLPAGEGVTFVLAAGRGDQISSGPTMATVMKAELERYLEKRRIPYSLIVNDTEYGVWSTLAEMKQAAKLIPADGSSVYVLGNWLQCYRVRLIGRWFTPGLKFSTVSCGEKEGHAFHELLAYGKLLLEMLWPSAEAKIESWRRKIYHLR